MSNWTKYCAPVLALVFALAVLSPVCCPQDVSNFGARKQNKTTHSHKKDEQCSDPVLQALVKPHCTFTTIGIGNSTLYIPAESATLTFRLTKPAFVFAQLPNVTHNGPPIHLLNNVFLN